MDKIVPIESVQAGTTQDMIAILEAQMARFTRLASALSAQAKTDYQALQSALQSGNVFTAGAALTRLEGDVKNAPATTATAAQASDAAAANAANGASAANGTHPSTPAPPKLDTTA